MSEPVTWRFLSANLHDGPPCDSASSFIHDFDIHSDGTTPLALPDLMIAYSLRDWLRQDRARENFSITDVQDTTYSHLWSLLQSGCDCGSGFTSSELTRSGDYTVAILSRGLQVGCLQLACQPLLAQPCAISTLI